MAAIDAERFLDNLPVEIPVREEIGVVAMESGRDQHQVIISEIAIVSGDTVSELETIQA